MFSQGRSFSTPDVGKVSIGIQALHLGSLLSFKEILIC